MPNIHLIKTPEYDYDKYDEVVELLNSFNGPIQFESSENEFSISEFPYLGKFYPDFHFKYSSAKKKAHFDMSRSHPLSWQG